MIASPEIGLTMVRARIGNRRDRFNAGDAGHATRLAAPAAGTLSGGEQQRVNIARGSVRPACACSTSPLHRSTRPTAASSSNSSTRPRHRARAIVGIFHDEQVRDAVADRCVELG